MNYLAIFIGGGIGSLLRFFFTQISLKMGTSHFPVGTFISNMLACLIMGSFVLFMADKENIPLWQKQFILVGLCGGFSTFSTFSLETLKLLKEGSILWASLNILVSLITCIGILYFLSKKIA